jgi:hypothetical protein
VRGVPAGTAVKTLEVTAVTAVKTREDPCLCTARRARAEQRDGAGVVAGSAPVSPSPEPPWEAATRGLGGLGARQGGEAEVAVRALREELSRVQVWGGALNRVFWSKWCVV